MGTFLHVRIHVHIFGIVCDFLSFFGNVGEGITLTLKC
jgi:hypothetical protein